MNLEEICCRCFPLLKWVLSRFGGWTCSVRSAWRLEVLGLPGKCLRCQSMEEKQFPWKVQGGNEHSEECHALALFPGCFIGRNVVGLRFFFLKNQNPMHILLG